MRTSCRFSVAVHVLAVLAYKEGKVATSSCLAASVNTNPVVIRRLLHALRDAGFVETHKGPGSGTRLIRKPERIPLSDVFRAVETEEQFATHAKPNRDCPVGSCIQAALQKVFASAENALQRELARTTLADIVRAARTCTEQTKGSK